jgi:Chaperonin 10 Kd subunit
MNEALTVHTRAAMPAHWAMTQHNRATILQQLSELSGDAAVLRQALASYDDALTVRTRAAMRAAPIDLKKGDRVLFGKWSDTEVKIDGVEYLIMKESDIMGVIEQNVARTKAA